uniref:Ovule protein n=1 Tax=Brugia timori TaxID=42155 RepID=A0A0R3R8X4_9BILA
LTTIRINKCQMSIHQKELCMGLHPAFLSLPAPILTVPSSVKKMLFVLRSLKLKRNKNHNGSKTTIHQIYWYISELQNYE